MASPPVSASQIPGLQVCATTLQNPALLHAVSVGMSSGFLLGIRELCCHAWGCASYRQPSILRSSPLSSSSACTLKTKTQKRRSAAWPMELFIRLEQMVCLYLYQGMLPLMQRLVRNRS